MPCGLRLRRGRQRTPLGAPTKSLNFEPTPASWRTTRKTDILPSSMLHRSSTFRLFITLLLAVAVPLCCCNLRMGLTACEPCDAASSHATVEPVAHEHADGNGHDHESDHHASTSSKEGIEPDSSPCGPGHEDDHDCSCGKQNTLLTVAKSNLDLPTPVLVAILSFPAFADMSALPLFRAVERGLWVSARPPTTLLRLHCALIV